MTAERPREYPCHRAAQLISPAAYPTFQALESAVGFCLRGCVECVVAPEQNIHGILTAKETVNKLLLTSVRVFLVPDLHAKGVVTPLGIITGSTNITHSGRYAQSQNANYFAHDSADYAGNRTQLLGRCEGLTPMEEIP